MRIIKLAPLKDFWEVYPEAQEPLEAWLEAVGRASWSNPNEVRQAYGTASIIGNNRVVFNIHGNTFRLIVAISYHAQIVLVKFVGTHRAYDAVDAESVDLYGRAA